MYYEEKYIGGVLCYRNTPHGRWYRKDNDKEVDMTHTTGAIRAAKEELVEVLGVCVFLTDTFTPEQLLPAKRAYEHLVEAEKTHAEMLAFIEKVAAWDFDSGHFHTLTTQITNAQKEALGLIKNMDKS
jgi:hypothetical protein